jgi:hypothetical protein
MIHQLDQFTPTRFSPAKQTLHIHHATAFMNDRHAQSGILPNQLSIASSTADNGESRKLKKSWKSLG